MNPSPDRDLARIDAARLSRLWAAAASTPPASTGGGPAEPVPPRPDFTGVDLAALLRSQLASPLGPPPDGDPADGPDAPVTHADLLAQPAPSAVLLRRVKERAKPMMAGDGGDLPRQVAGVLYFAAVAAGRLRGAGHVSDLPDDRVRGGAAWALRLPWLDDPGLSSLFREAVDALGPGAAGGAQGSPPGRAP